MIFATLRSVFRLLIPLSLLILAGCVPVPTGGGVQPGATPPPPTEAIHIDAAPTGEVTPTGIAGATIDAGLLITPPQAVTITLPISPDHSIGGPVGDPQMHGTPVGEPTTNDASH